MSTLRDQIFGWGAMFLAIMSGATIGPMFKYMENQHIPPILAASWRCQCMLFFLVPMAIMEANSNKSMSVDWFSKKPDLTFTVAGHIFIAG
jgi:hypothetical protein